MQNAQRQLQALLCAYGYGEVEVPVLERADLYLRKLGSQMAGLMFTFADQYGERLCLRPEFTGSVIRSYIDHAAELPLPVRWQYCGSVFRDGAGPLRQFTQLGAELIGAGAPRADAELLAVACRGLERLGAPSPRLVLGHAGFIPSLFDELGLSERTKLYLISRLALFKAGDSGLDQLRQGLAELRVASSEAAATSGGAPTGLSSADGVGILEWFLQVGATRPTGRRSPGEIVERFRAKHQSADDPKVLEQALWLAAEVSGVRAAPSVALKEVAAIAGRHQVGFTALRELEGVLAALDAFSLQGIAVEIDFGLTRPLGYYTGIIFELYAGASSRPVGGGGRYDDLVPALGGPARVPALGFAYTLEELLAACPLLSPASPAVPESVLVVAESDADFGEAVREAERLRGLGKSAVLEVSARSEVERRSYCRQVGISSVLLVSAAGVKVLAVAG